ncbi:MAG: hypothetical protein SGJ02_06420 [bacterium]|nr:hypothetical protein [bacterium]
MLEDHKVDIALSRPRSLQLGRTPHEILLIDALDEAFAKLRQLAESGKTFRGTNQHGENQLLADFELEESTIQILRKANLPARIISEEHGEVLISTSPQFTVHMDGLDGSGLYLKGGAESRFFHMIGIHNDCDPSYADYSSAGFIDLVSGDIFIASAGKGALLIKQNGVSLGLKIKESFAQKTRVHADESICANYGYDWNELQRIGEPITIQCCAAKFADLLTGKVDLVLEGTRKGNLEQIIAYALICEAGGCVLDHKGQDIGTQKILNYGQKEKLPLIFGGEIRRTQIFMNNILQRHY